MVLSSLGETNAKESELVSVSGSTINVSFDLGLPLLDDGALFVTGQFHAVEVGQTVVTLDFFADQSRITTINKHEHISKMLPEPLKNSITVTTLTYVLTI